MGKRKLDPAPDEDVKAPWEEDAGWDAIDVGEDFLLGADEYGFMGLEVLNPPTKGGAKAAADGEAEAEAEEKAPKKKKERQAKRRKSAAEVAAEAAAAGGEEEGPKSVKALQAELAALKAENSKLKGQQQAEEGSGGQEKKGKGKREKKAAAEEEAPKRQQQQQQKPKKGKSGAKPAAAGPSVPRADVSAWKEYQLHPAIEEAIAELGFSAPTAIQAECLPAAVRDRRDVIGAAQTGSGKTLAFGLPILQLLQQEKEAAEAAAAGGTAEEQAAVVKAQRAGGLRALVLAPTRELALQVCAHLQAVGKSCGIWAVPIVGGISALKQERLLGKHPEVVVATPGRLWDLMREGHHHLTDLSRLAFLVIDEADRMVQQGHYSELSNIMGAIPAVAARDAPGGAGEEGEEEAEGAGVEAAAGPAAAELGGKKGKTGPKRRGRGLQTFVFSATLTLPSALRKRLRKGGGGSSGSADLDSLMEQVPFHGKPKIVDLTSQRKLADKVTEAHISCPDEERDEYLYCLLACHPGRTIVFVNAISSVRRLAAILKTLGIEVQPLHAGMQQRQRLKALDRFKSSEAAVLVATDVAARGLDVKDVRCVIHYQLPASADVYVHRSGRTARAEAEGISIALVTPRENGRYMGLLRALRREDPTPEFPVDLSLMPAIHKRVRLAVRLDNLVRSKSKAAAELAWKRQHAEEVGIMLSEDEGGSEDGRVQSSRAGKKARREVAGSRGADEAASAEEIRSELAELLAEPLAPSFSQRFFTGGAAAGVAAQISSAAEGGGKSTAAQRKKAGGGKAGTAYAAGEEEEDARRQPVSAAATVSRAVALAQAVSDTRAKALAQKPRVVAAAAAAKKGRQAANPRAAALAAALAKHHDKKSGKKGSKLLVIPQAFGRDARGPDALQTLRMKMAPLNS